MKIKKILEQNAHRPWEIPKDLANYSEGVKVVAWGKKKTLKSDWHNH